MDLLERFESCGILIADHAESARSVYPSDNDGRRHAIKHMRELVEEARIQRLRKINPMTPNLTDRIFPPGDPRAPFHCPVEPKRKVYKVEMDGSSLIVESLGAAMDEIRGLAEEGEPGNSFTLHVVEMTQRELDAMPEFGGW